VRLTTTGSGDIALSRNVAAGTASATLVSAGNISGGSVEAGTVSLTGGTIDLAVDAGTLTGTAGATATIDGTVATLGGFTSHGGLTLTDAGPLRVTGAVQDLTAGGLISLKTNAGDLALAAGGSIATTNGDVLLEAAGGVGLAGAVSAGTARASLEAHGGGVNESGAGRVTAGALAVAAAGASALEGANSVGTLAAAVSGAGEGFSFVNAGRTLEIGTVAVAASPNAAPAPVSGVSTADGNVRLTTTGTGDIAVSKNVSAGMGGATLVSDGNIGGGSIEGGTVSLTAAGDIAATVTAGTLNADAGGSVEVSGGIGTLGSFAAGSFVRATDTSGDLVVAGPVSAGTDISIKTAGTLTVSGPVSAAGAVALQSAGDLVLGATTSQGGFALTNAAPLQVAGAVHDLTAGGRISLRTTAGNLSVNAGGSVTSTNGDVLLEAAAGVEVGDLVSAGIGSVYAAAHAGGVSESGAGRIVARELALTATDRSVLNGANSVGTLAAIVTGPGKAFGFNNSGRTLAVDAVSVAAGANITPSAVSGVLGGGDVTLATTSSGDIVVLRDIGAGGAARLSAAGTLRIGGVAISGGSILGQAGGSVSAANSTLAATGPEGIQMRAGGAIVLDGGRFSGPTLVFASSGQFTQAGTTRFDAPLVGIATTGLNPATLLAALRAFRTQPAAAPLPGMAGADITLDHPQSAPGQTMWLVPGAHNVTGTVDVKELAVFGDAGNAMLSGTINGVSGQGAAQLVFKSGQPDNNYRFNDCAIGSPSCVSIPTLTPVAPRIVNEIIIIPNRRNFRDVDAQLISNPNEDLM
jgi:filamentous hemagglutinin